MSIKTFSRIVFRHAFQQAFQDNALGRIWDIFRCRYKFYAVVAQRLLMDRRLVLVP